MKEKVSYTLVILALGAVLALITKNLAFFEYNNEFNIFDLFYFIATTGIALFITNRIDDALQRRRSQKDIIIKKIEEVDNEIKDLLPLFEYSDNKYHINNTTLLFKVKNISQWAKRYEKSVEKYYKALYDDTCFQKINTRKLVRQCTRLNPDNEDDISCIHDKWNYSQSQYVSINKEIENLRTICYNNIILLNNCS